MNILFSALVALVGLIAAGIASVAGFGIGSLLTPTLALETGTKVAVAAIAIPHVIATAQRFWLLRRFVDRPLRQREAGRHVGEHHAHACADADLAHLLRRRQHARRRCEIADDA